MKQPWMGTLLAFVALLVIAALSACAPTLIAESGPPPGRAARLDAVTGFWGTVKSYRAELTTGVALAVSCMRGGPCEKLVVTSDDMTVAEVRMASLATLQPGVQVNQQPTSAFVVVGKAAGSTMVHVRSRDGDREMRVTVVAPPAPIQHPAVAQ